MNLTKREEREKKEKEDMERAAIERESGVRMFIESQKEKKKEHEKLEQKKQDKKRTDQERKDVLYSKQFHVKIKYKCSKICGKKHYTFDSNKEKFPFIGKGDIVLYDNDKHINHNREAKVVSWELSGTGSTDIEKSEKVPNFLIKFTDKIDKLPFYKETINGVEVTTNKKIVMLQASYKDLKLTFSQKNNDRINIILGPKEKLKGQLSKSYGDKNKVYEFHTMVIKGTAQIAKIVKDIDEKRLIRHNKKEVYEIKKAKGELIRLIAIMKNEEMDDKKIDKLILYFDTIFAHDKYTDVQNDDGIFITKNLFIYYFLYFELFRKSKKNFKYIKNKENYKSSDISDKSLKKIQKLFLDINEKFKDLENFLFGKYSNIFKQKNVIEVTEAGTKINKKNIAKIYNRPIVDEKLGIRIEKYTNQHYILDELTNIVRKHFKINKEFKPLKVFLKYANPELVKRDIIDKQTEKTEKPETLTDMTKLVNPTDDKMFILKSISPIFTKNYNKLLYDADDFFTEKVNIDLKNRIIEVEIVIGLSIKDRKSQETIFKDTSTEKNFMNSIRDFTTSLKDNLKCQISKENIKKDIKDIKDRLGMSGDVDDAGQ